MLRRLSGSRVGRVNFLGWDQWEMFVNLWAIIGNRECLKST